MGFGRNPHVAKAEAAELKAQEAEDGGTEVRAWLEAAHLWERAAGKELPGKKRDEYEGRANAARERSNAPVHNGKANVDSVVARLKLVHPSSTRLH